MKCKRKWGFLWRQHCQHYGEVEKVGCKSGLKESGYRCCRCGAIRLLFENKWQGGK